MSVIERVKNAYKAFNQKNTKYYDQQQLLDFLGLRGTKKDALSESTYFACIKVLSEALGKLPLKLLRYNDKNGVAAARTHPLYDILHNRPNPYMTSSIFWSTMEQNRNHHGNAYALIKGAGSRTTLWILPSEQVEVWYDNCKTLGEVEDIYYIYTCSAGRFCFGSEEILHFKNSNTFDGIKGISVREQLLTSIEGNIKAQRMLNKMYENGFTAKAVVQYTSDLSEENLKKFKTGLEKFAGSDLDDEEVHNIIPIPYGTTLTPLNIKLADNQFIEVKKYSALQIASAFGIKPYQIGDYEKSSYSSAEAQQLSFYVDTLLFIIKQYEEEINYKLLSREENAKGYHFKFNIAVILRADLQTQITTLSTAVANFIYTPNEARALLDLESKDGGDQLLGNGASIPIQYAGSQYIELENKGKEETKAWMKKSIEEIMTKLLTKA